MGEQGGQGEQGEQGEGKQGWRIGESNSPPSNVAQVRFPVPAHMCIEFVILYTLRFSHQILLCEKALRILLRPIREAKRVSHT